MLDLVGCWAPALPTGPDTAPGDHCLPPPAGLLPPPDVAALVRAHQPYLDGRAAGLCYSPGPAYDPCSPQGLVSLHPDPTGVQVLAVVPLPDGSLTTLATRNPLLHELACRAAAARCQPGAPGCAVQELAGGWRGRSLAELQAAALGGVPAPATPCGTPDALPWSWHAAPPAHQQLKRQHSELAACARPAESTSSRSASQTGSSGGGKAKSALREAASSAPRRGASQAGNASGSAPLPSPSEDEGGCDDGEEVCSARKRRCLGASSGGGASPQPAPAPRAGLPAGQAPRIRVPAPAPLLPSQLSGELPQFSEEELELLQECLQEQPEPAPRSSQHTDGRTAASHRT